MKAALAADGAARCDFRSRPSNWIAIGLIAGAGSNWLFVCRSALPRVHTEHNHNAASEPCRLFLAPLRRQQPVARIFFGTGDPVFFTTLLRLRGGGRVRRLFESTFGMEIRHGALGRPAATISSVFHRGFLAVSWTGTRTGYADDLCAASNFTPLFRDSPRWADMSTVVATIESQNPHFDSSALVFVCDLRCWLGGLVTSHQPHILVRFNGG